VVSFTSWPLYLHGKHPGTIGQKPG